MKIFQLVCIINVSDNFSPNHRLLSTCLDPVRRLPSSYRDRRNGTRSSTDDNFIAIRLKFLTAHHCFQQKNNGTTGIPRMRIYLRNLSRHKSKWLRIPLCDWEISKPLTTVESDRAQTRRRVCRNFFKRRKKWFFAIYSSSVAFVPFILCTTDGYPWFKSYYNWCHTDWCQVYPETH